MVATSAMVQLLRSGTRVAIARRTRRTRGRGRHQRRLRGRHESRRHHPRTRAERRSALAGDDRRRGSRRRRGRHGSRHRRLHSHRGRRRGSRRDRRPEAAAIAVAPRSSRSLLRIWMRARSRARRRDGDEADDVGREAHAPLHLGDGRRRSVDVHQRVVRLAVLLDLEGEGLEAPVLGLADLAAAFGDDIGEFFRQRLDLRLTRCPGAPGTHAHRAAWICLSLRCVDCRGLPRSFLFGAKPLLGREQRVGSRKGPKE